MAKEYIEREAAIGALRRRLGPNTSPAQKNMLQLAAIDIRSIKAADVAPVVRCKECKHLVFSDCYGECGKGHMGIVSPDDFCSYGERRDA